MPKPAVKDASGLYEVERRAYHAARPGFRVAELQISPTQKVPWHSHSNVQDTFYVIEGELQLFSCRIPRRTCASSQARRIRCGQDGRTS
jgi:hypothetical protein